MSWITVIWSMVASACLTLAMIHLLIWCKRRAARADLLFSLASLSVVALGGCEFWMMRAETPAQFGTALRWLHVPTWVFILALVSFIRLHLRAGRPWLAWTVCAMRSLSLLLDFLVGQNLNYREVTGLRHIPFLGDSVSVGVGVSNPWMLVGQLSLVLFLVFVADAVLTVWRRGDRGSALATAGSILFFALAGVVQAVLVLWQVLDWPITASLFYLGIAAAMAYETSLETLRAAQLSDDLLESEERMALAVNAAGVGVWVWRFPGNRVWGSETWLRLFDFAPGADVSFDQVIQRIHPDDREMIERGVRRAAADRVDYVGEYRVLMADGSQRWIMARGRMLPGANARAERMLGVAIDITHRKQADLEIARQRNELTHLSRVSLLGELAGSLAHELNQPLTAILSNAQAAQRFLARDSASLDEVRNILNDIVTDDQRAGEVIRRLRMLLKRGEVLHVPVDLNEVVQEVLRLARNDLSNHDIRVSTGFTPGLGVVLGDRVQLQQVVLNLIVNAIDAMAIAAPGDRRLRVCTERVPEGGVRVSVVDRGAGLTTEACARLFEPYFTTKPLGMGLGLSVCRTIVTSHGGQLGGGNNPDKGATFYFTLPVAVKEQP